MPETSHVIPSHADMAPLQPKLTSGVHGEVLFSSRTMEWDIHINVDASVESSLLFPVSFSPDFPFLLLLLPLVSLQ